jgi:NagD protein
MAKPKNYLIDMDGVLVRGTEIVPGADGFIDRLQASGTEYLVLTNNPLYTPGDLAHRLHTIGLNVPAERIFTSALATGRFLQGQGTICPPDGARGTAYVLGESGLTEAVHAAGYVITATNPDYVVLGETHSYSFDLITQGIRLIMAGSRFIATNPDPSGPGDGGAVPACGAMAALIERATGVSPFFIGKPNPFMMRAALNFLGVHSEDTVMIGDRMDTDIVAGVESGMDTILVLTGVTRREDVARYPYQPGRIVDSVADVDPAEWEAVPCQAKAAP